MSWEDIIKNDMESREKGRGVYENEAVSKLIDEVKRTKNNLGDIIDVCQSTISQLSERPELADKKYIEDTLIEIIKIAKSSPKYFDAKVV